MVAKDKALPGRAATMPVSPLHFVLKTPMREPFPPGTKKIILANGCFWGSEKGMWRLPPAGGIVSTAVGYAAGYTPNPTYDEVCSGRTGHTEAVQVVYDPSKISLVDILRWFWQSHDPTQLNRRARARAPRRPRAERSAAQAGASARPLTHPPPSVAPSLSSIVLFYVLRIKNQQAGQRRRHAVPQRRLLLRRGAEGAGRGLKGGLRGRDGRQGLRADRHPNRFGGRLWARALLLRRGLPPAGDPRAKP